MIEKGLEEIIDKYSLLTVKTDELLQKIFDFLY